MVVVVYTRARTCSHEHWLERWTKYLPQQTRPPATRSSPSRLIVRSTCRCVRNLASKLIPLDCVYLYCQPTTVLQQSINAWSGPWIGLSPGKRGPFDQMQAHRKRSSTLRFPQKLGAKQSSSAPSLVPLELLCQLQCACLRKLLVGCVRARHR